MTGGLQRLTGKELIPFSPDSKASGVLASDTRRVACLRFGAVCALELCCWHRCRAPFAGCCCKVLLSECCVRFGAWLLVPLQGRVPLQGAAVRVLLELGCWCSCRVLSQGACVRVTFRLWSLVAGAAVLRCCRMPVRVVFALLLPLQGAAAGRCCQSAVCALDAAAGCCFQGWKCCMRLGTWVRASGGCRCRAPLQGAATGCCCQCGVWACELGCWCCRVEAIKVTWFL